MSEKRKRHRWKATNDHWYPGPKYWQCIHCGLKKTTEYCEKPTYHQGEKRWRRFAPPCPPDTLDAIR
jgi:hypothetical protein